MQTNMDYINYIRRSCPDGVAVVRGGPKNPGLYGTVEFYQTREGVLVAADVSGLPGGEGSGGCGWHGFHIHAGSDCGGNETSPFADALGHYNPAGTEHPCHAGDLPPLLSDDGKAYMLFLTGRFTVREVVGHVVIIHTMPDDFHTQPSGNSGEMIACGKIMKS